MDILVFSDSHGATDKIEEMFSRTVRRPDAVIFLGDGIFDLPLTVPRDVPIYSVRGNCDFFADAPDELLIELGGKRIFATHGHKYSVKHGNETIIERAKELSCDILLFGHTHFSEEDTVEYGGKTLHIMNPGSLGANFRFGNIVIKDGNILTSLGRL